MMKGAAAKAAPEAAREAPYSMYRGAPNADGLFPTDRPLFMSSSPEVAGTYAGMVPRWAGCWLGRSGASQLRQSHGRRCTGSCLE